MKKNIKKKASHQIVRGYILQKKIFRIFSGIEWNIICTTVSADVMLSVRTHSCAMPTAPMQ